MEPFFDGGLFEVLFAIGMGYFLNFIFQRKLLLVIYTGVSIMAPVLLLFVKTGEIYYWSVGITIFNAVLLAVLFWKQKFTEPGKPLFDTEKYLADFLDNVKTWRRNFMQTTKNL